MPWMEIPLSGLVTRAGATRPISVVGTGEVLSTADDDTGYVDLQNLANSTGYATNVSWATGVFDGSALPANVLIDEAYIRFQNRGDGVESFVNMGVYSGALLNAGTAGAPDALLTDLTYDTTARTSTLWVLSENQVDNPLALRYDLSMSAAVGKTDTSAITADKVRAGQVNGVVWNDFAGDRHQRVSYIALYVHYLYVGPWIQGPDFAFEAGVESDPDWHPVPPSVVDNEYGFLTFPGQPNASSADARTAAWDRTFAGMDDGSPSPFWRPDLGGPPTLVDPSTEVTVSLPTGSPGNRGRVRFTYDYSAPVGTTGDSAKFARRDIVFPARPEAAAFTASTAITDLVDAVGHEVEAEYADPDIDRGYGALRFFNYLTKVEWQVDQAVRSYESAPADGDAKAAIYPKAWSATAAGLGPFTGTPDITDGYSVSYLHTAPNNVPTLIGTVIQVNENGTVTFPGADPDVEQEGMWENPYDWPSTSGLIDGHEPKYPVVFVMVSKRTSEPGVTPTVDWSEQGAAVRMLARYTMRPPRHRFLYETSQSSYIRLVDTAENGGTIWRVGPLDNPDGGIGRLILPDGRRFVQDPAGFPFPLVAPDGTRFELLLSEEP